MSGFARPCPVCGARIPPGGSCPVCSKRASSCRICGRRSVGAYCSEHSAAGERLERQPWREGYSDPAYWRARAERYALAGGRCELCGVEVVNRCECDHVVALRDGGANVVENLRVLCVRCHRAKTRAERTERRGRR